MPFMKQAASPSKVTGVLNKIAKTHENQVNVHLQTLIKELKSISYFGLIFIISLFFSFPIPLPGISTPFGLILCSLGIGIIFNFSFWLPKWVLKREIKYDSLKKIIHYSEIVFKKIEDIARPRYTFFCKSYIFKKITGLIIFIQGFLLALPLPIPFTNVIAAFPLLVISVGLLEEDGAILLMGYFFSFISMLSFVLLFMGVNTFIKYL
jgi:hypothetical protein